MLINGEPARSGEVLWSGDRGFFLKASDGACVRPIGVGDEDGEFFRPLVDLDETVVGLLPCRHPKGCVALIGPVFKDGEVILRTRGCVC